KISSEDLDHLIMLQMMGNDEITQSYLNTLQDKYTQVVDPANLPTHTGGNQSDDIRKYPNHTGGNQQLKPGSIPNHTGNGENQSGVASNHTGNTEGKPDVGGNTTVTPIPDGTTKDNLAYLAEGRDNRLPIPETTVAGNGLKIESNSKHTPGAQGFRPNAGIEPRDSLSIFEGSVSIDSDKHRYAKDSNGHIHRFSPNNTGAYHWSGSTGDSKNKLELTGKVKSRLQKQEGWKIK
ncbi:hypothetical protein, partial [Photorhabdus bodei]|uniref:hypothetical protein n=1 Tax=Photorhabdus bodei TaxID=2029681 RepID=UPI001E5613AB